MTDIVKIVIKSESGYGPADEAYTDRLTITPSSVSYEYKPHKMSSAETNIYRKWSYKTTSPVFAEVYRRIAGMAPNYLHRDVIEIVADTGATEITALFEDGHREKVTYWCSDDFFREWFAEIKKMIPETEYMPAAILTRDEFSE